jgi:hypothetical protein
MEETKKPAWSRPENWVAWLGLGVGGYFALKFLDVLLPLLERVLENTIYTAALAAIVGVLGWIVVSKDFHRLAWMGYKMAMRWLTSLVINIDPISILEGYVEELKKKFGEISSALASLRAQSRELTQLIQTKTSHYEHSMNLAKEARDHGAQAGMKTQFAIQSRKAGRLEKTALTYQGLLNKIKAHIALMEKVQEASKYMIADIEDTVEEETEKRKTIRASYRAMAASKAILQADKDREMYDLALSNVQSDYFNKLGEIDQFMEDSKDFINTMDLENGIADLDAMAKLEAWDQRASSLLEGGSGKTKFRVGGDSPLARHDELDTESSPDTKKPQSFASLFDKLD